MIEIKDLLSRFEGILFSEEAKKQSLVEIISRIIKVPINTEDVKVKHGTVFLNIKPIYKNEILMKREKILDEMENMLGKKSPRDIR